VRRVTVSDLSSIYSMMRINYNRPTITVFFSQYNFEKPAMRKGTSRRINFLREVDNNHRIIKADPSIGAYAGREDHGRHNKSVKFLERLYISHKIYEECRYKTGEPKQDEITERNRRNTLKTASSVICLNNYGIPS
jgi:hypothetical protein